jgi:hypothetical protein
MLPEITGGTNYCKPGESKSSRGGWATVRRDQDWSVTKDPSVDYTRRIFPGEREGRTPPSVSTHSLLTGSVGGFSFNSNNTV